MSRNYSLGSRDMCRAVKYAMNNDAHNKQMSYLTATTVSERFNHFGKYAKKNGEKYLEYITRETLIKYGIKLSIKVKNAEMSASYAQNLVSSVNTVMRSVTKSSWVSVSPTKDCSIPKRSFIRKTIPNTYDKRIYNQAKNDIKIRLGDRAKIIISLARDFGLRSKEACLIDAHSALKEALSTNKVTIINGTKGGRARTVPILNTEQISILKKASYIQQDDKSLIPSNQNWKSFRDGELRNIRETLNEISGDNLHDLRAAYACTRYHQLTGSHPPVISNSKIDTQLDSSSRLTIAEELGHSRLSITNSYLGV